MNEDANHRSTQTVAPPDAIGATATGAMSSRDDSPTAVIGADEAASATAPLIPGYEFLHVLGRGGMGIVWKARQLSVNRIVAFKMILAGEQVSEKQRARFQAEAEAVAGLQHPNVVPLLEYGTHRGYPYFTLEFMEGGALAEKISDSPLAARAAAQLLEQVARGVAAAHAHNLIHRDLKPGNILLAADGTPKIADFGLVKHLEETSRTAAVTPEAKAREENPLTRTGEFIGTPAYMAPEQACGDRAIGAAADIWALGAILYRVLTGRPPFLGANLYETIEQVIHTEPVPPRSLVPGLARDLETICLKCLRKEPVRRYVSAGQLADDLRCFLDGKPILARPVGRIERGVKWVRRNPVVSALLIAVLAASALGAAGIYVKYRDAKEQEAIAKSNEREAIRQAAIARDNETKATGALVARDAAIKDLNYNLTLDHILLAQAAFDGKGTALAHERLDRVTPELRHWEWPYLKRQFTGGIYTIAGHTSAVNSVAISPDGTRIVTASFDRTAKVWDARTGMPLVEFKGHSGSVISVAFSPDGSRIVTASLDRTTKIWDARTGVPLFDLKGQTGVVLSAAFSPDGGRIVTASRDRTAKVWDAQTGALLITIPAHANNVTSVAFSPDGTRLVTGGNDLIARVWDAGAGALQFELKAHANNVNSVSFSPDGARIVTGSDDRTAKVWDARTGTLLLNLQGHSNWVSSASFSPDGTRIVTASHDQTAKVWDARTGTPRLDLKGHTSLVTSVAFSPDGLRIVTGSADFTAKVWDGQTGTPALDLKGHTGYVWNASFSPDGARLITGSLDGTAKVWDTKTARPLLDLRGHARWVNCASFSPDGTRIVTGSFDLTAMIRDAQTGTEQLVLMGHSEGITSASFSPDGTSIVTGSWDRTAKVWNAQTGVFRFDLKGHAHNLSSVSFSPDGTRIATASWDKTAKVWDAQTGAHQFDLPGHTEMLTSVSFSRDGTRIVTSSWDKTAKVWDARTGAFLLALKGHAGWLESAAFSPDGTRIVTGGHDHTAKVWDVQTGTPLLELKGHANVVSSVAFSLDGTRIATASHDGTARIWDAHGGQQLLGDSFSDEWDYRMFWTRPRPDLHRQEFDKAIKAKDTFAAGFQLDRLLAGQPQERLELLGVRSKLPSIDLFVAARTAVHSPALAKAAMAPIVWKALHWDPRALRLLGGLLIRAGKSADAVIFLKLALVLRGNDRPPVEELLLALAHLDVNQSGEAAKWHAKAVAWLDRYQTPMQVTLGGVWSANGELLKSQIDPRYNAFDWETWYECVVFRAEVAARLK